MSGILFALCLKSATSAVFRSDIVRCRCFSRRLERKSCLNVGQFLKLSRQASLATLVKWAAGKTGNWVPKSAGNSMVDSTQASNRTVLFWTIFTKKITSNTLIQPSRLTLPLSWNLSVNTWNLKQQYLILAVVQVGICSGLPNGDFGQPVLNRVPV